MMHWVIFKKRVALKYWVSNYVAYFTVDTLVCPVVVESPRDSYPGGYTPQPVKEDSSQRSEVLSTAG